MWAITSHHDTINDRAAHQAEVQRVPSAFTAFTGYDDYKKKRKAKPNLNVPILQSHADGLLTMLLKPIFANEKWKDWGNDISRLAACLGSYAKYLRTELQKQTKRQTMDHPARQVNNTFSS